MARRMANEPYQQQTLRKWGLRKPRDKYSMGKFANDWRKEEKSEVPGFEPRIPAGWVFSSIATSWKAWCSLAGAYSLLFRPNFSRRRSVQVQDIDFGPTRKVPTLVRWSLRLKSHPWTNKLVKHGKIFRLANDNSILESKSCLLLRRPN